MPYAKIGDIQLYYEIDGHGDDLLLLHGVTSFLPAWKYLRAELRQHFRLILPELRGHGRSDKPKGDYLIEMYAEDLAHLLDELKISQCIVAGHSMGGFVAQKMALDFSQYVRSLILICTAPRVDEVSAKAETEPGMAVYGLPVEEAAKKRMEIVSYDPKRQSERPGMMELLYENEKQNQANVESHTAAMGGLLRFNFEPRLGEIKVPTLVVQGSQDKSFPLRWGEYFKKNIPNSVLKIVDNTGHNIHLEQPEALARAIVEFSQAL